MIAAVGRFEMGSLVEALRGMALNQNPAYDHELRSKGEALRHDCGWGIAFRRAGGLARVRSTRPCFDDSAFDALGGLATDVVILHARRVRDRSSIAEENTHPFMAVYGGTTYAFCHNGEMKDRRELLCDPALVPEGTTDSEELFHHVLTALDREDPAGSMSSVLGGIEQFTSLNSFLLTPSGLTAYARTAPGSDRPRYYALWRGSGRGFVVVSSEIVGGLEVRWERMADGSATHLCPEAL